MSDTNSSSDQHPAPSSLAFAILTLFIAMASIQGGASIAKSLFPVLGAIGTTALRVSLAALMLAAFFRPWRGGFNRFQISSILRYGLALGSMNLMFYLALARIPLGVAVTLEFSGPLLLAALTSRRLIDGLWILLAFGGMLLLMPLGEFSAALDPIGVAFALGAGLSWALYIIFGQQASRQMPGTRASSLGMLVAAGIALPVGIWQAGDKLLNPELLIEMLPLALLIAILSSALPYSLEMIALKRLPAKTFGILMSVEPALAALSGLIFLHEMLTPLQWLAVLFVMSASIGSAMSARIPADHLPD